MGIIVGVFGVTEAACGNPRRCLGRENGRLPGRASLVRREARPDRENGRLPGRASLVRKVPG